MKASLEQWRALQAVVDHGGFARAAQVLHKSQSSVSYSVASLQERLGLGLLRVEGRKAVLTTAGEAMLHRARQLLDDAGQMEALAESLTHGWEAEVRLAVDTIFPTSLLTRALHDFAAQSRGARVQLREEVLSGAEELLVDGWADVAIVGRLPTGFLGEQIIMVEMMAVAHPEHPLHHLGGTNISARELARELQVVIRDSGMRRQRDEGWLGAEQRWTVSSMDTAVSVIASGLGFGWLPRHRIEEELTGGVLRPLPLSKGRSRRVPLYLVFSRRKEAGPGAQALADMLTSAARKDASGN
ncbi:MAG TPA: LysR family transcriptional regulator [Mariprofundaceae bacterium]|nr:LysR family transcriptional regulator [Mariprofundaceae bacterium]